MKLFIDKLLEEAEEVKEIENLIPKDNLIEVDFDDFEIIKSDDIMLEDKNKKYTVKMVKSGDYLYKKRYGDWFRMKFRNNEETLDELLIHRIIELEHRLDRMDQTVTASLQKIKEYIDLRFAQ